MSKPQPFARISLTLPPEVLAAADRLAAESDRSRSWVIAEAIRRLTSEGGVVPSHPPASDGSLLARLPADRARSAEERVLAGERMAATREREEPDRLLSFRSYQAYLAWSRRTGGRRE